MQSNPSWHARYARQLSLPGMSQDSQSQLAAAQVVILGMSGPASACAVHLVESGLGHLTIIDGLRVDEADLCEQFIYSEADIGAYRADAAREFLSRRNSNLKVNSLREPFTPHSAERLIASSDIIIDSLEDWQSKILASDVCMQTGRILVHCHIRGFEFHMYTMIPGRSACLRCLLAGTGSEDLVSAPLAPGSFGPLSGMAGSFQAIEAIKLITGLGTTPGNHLIKFDALRREFDEITDLNPRPDCPDCGRPF